MNEPPFNMYDFNIKVICWLSSDADQSEISIISYGNHRDISKPPVYLHNVLFVNIFLP